MEKSSMFARKRSIAKFSMMVYLFMALSGDGTIVRCVGENGHVALQLMSGSCCNHNHAAPRPSAVFMAEDLDGCCTSGMSGCECTDMALAFGFLPAGFSREGMGSPKNLSPAKCFVAGLSLAPHASTFRCLYEQAPPDFSDPAAHSLQTVVLII